MWRSKGGCSSRTSAKRGKERDALQKCLAGRKEGPRVEGRTKVVRTKWPFAAAPPLSPPPCPCAAVLLPPAAGVSLLLLLLLLLLPLVLPTGGASSSSTSSSSCSTVALDAMLAAGRVVHLLHPLPTSPGVLWVAGVWEMSRRTRRGTGLWKGSRRGGGASPRPLNGDAHTPPSQVLKNRGLVAQRHSSPRDRTKTRAAQARTCTYV